VSQDATSRRDSHESPVPRERSERAARLAGLIASLAGDAARAWLTRSREPKGALSEEAAQRVVDALSELRGPAIKLGQFASLQSDLLPSPLMDLLTRLRDQADAMPRAQVEGVLRRELGADWSGRFAEFDFEPLAAASIGQVHAAVARDGRDLAVKIQYPGVEQAIDSDVDALGRLLRTLGLFSAGEELEQLLPEMKRELHREADYRREAESTERYRALLGVHPDLEVPVVHRDLSTRRVLVTGRVRGVPIEDLRSVEHSAERRDRFGRALLQLALRELLELRYLQTDPNFANYVYQPKSERVALLDFGSVRRLSRRFIEAYARLMRASVEGRGGRIVRSATGLGLLGADASAELRGGFVELCHMAAEPLRHAGAYDFGVSDLPARVRSASRAAYAGRLPALPIEVLLLHRKLAGTFLLLQHIGARVDARALWLELQAARGGEAG
jgi:predicted unusual protein kinase regulating ubiquinone biosynthesis (AarF/ABC1/UbiB family)